MQFIGVPGSYKHDLSNQQIVFFNLIPGDEDDGSEQRSSLVCLVPNHLSTDDGNDRHAHRHVENWQSAASQ